MKKPQNAFVSLLVHVIAALCLLAASSCTKHEHDDNGGGGNIAYVVTIFPEAPIPPRTEVCAEIRDTTGHLAVGVNVWASPPNPLDPPIAFTTDAFGLVCFTPAAEVRDPEGPWGIDVEGPLGTSETVDFTPVAYRREVVLSTDTWFNNQDIPLRMIEVVGDQPTTNIVPFASFILARKDGTVIWAQETLGSGLVVRTNHLPPGVYDLWSQDDVTGLFAPVREIVSLAPNETALGLSFAGQLDENGDFLSNPRWWDGVENEQETVYFDTYLSQATHFGGRLDFDDPTGQPESYQVSPSETSLPWTPSLRGMWYGQVTLTLPIPGETSSVWRRHLVLPR